jgi:hypothetical protein
METTTLNRYLARTIASKIHDMMSGANILSDLQLSPRVLRQYCDALVQEGKITTLDYKYTLGYSYYNRKDIEECAWEYESGYEPEYGAKSASEPEPENGSAYARERALKYVPKGTPRVATCTYCGSVKPSVYAECPGCGSRAGTMMSPHDNSRRSALYGEQQNAGQAEMGQEKGYGTPIRLLVVIAKLILWVLIAAVGAWLWERFTKQPDTAIVLLIMIVFLVLLGLIAHGQLKDR